MRVCGHIVRRGCRFWRPPQELMALAYKHGVRWHREECNEAAKNYIPWASTSARYRCWEISGMHRVSAVRVGREGRRTSLLFHCHIKAVRNVELYPAFPLSLSLHNKTPARLLHAQRMTVPVLSQHTSLSKIICCVQFEFRKAKSTTDTIGKLVHEVLSAF